MKKLIVLLMIASLIMLCACNKPAQGGDVTTTAPTATDPVNADPTNGSAEPTAPIDWETPIDIDDSFVEVTDPAETDPTEEIDQPTEPSETEGTTDPVETEGATDPAEPTEGPTEVPTDPPSFGGTGSKPIELPMIPG